MNNDQSSKFKFSFKQTRMECVWVGPKHDLYPRL